MKRTLISLAAAAVMSAPAFAQQYADFAAIEVGWQLDLSQDGRYVSLGCGAGNERSLCIYDLVGGGDPQIMTPPDDARITGAEWASDRYLLIYLDTVTELNTTSGLHDVLVSRIASYDIEESDAALMMTGRNVTSALDNVSSLDLDDPEHILMQVSVRTSGGNRNSSITREEIATNVYRVRLEDGRDRRIERLRGETFRRMFDADGEPIADIRLDERRREFAIARVDEREPVYLGEHTGELPSVHHSGESDSVLVQFYEGERRGLNRLDLQTGEFTPAVEESLQGLIVDPVTDPWSQAFVGAGVFTPEGLPEEIYTDEELASLREALAGALGADLLNLISWSADRSMIAFETREPGRPAAYYVFDRNAGQVNPLGTEAPRLEGRRLGDQIAFSYEASDGLEIPAYVTLPPGATEADGPFPLVVMPHGGPQSRDDATFDWWAQAYASLGYAVLQANFRGSSGYGRDFIEAGFGEFGGKMVQDNIDGARHLVDAGIAREGGYCTAGASYGGYAALMMGILDPENVECVIATAPVIDAMSVLAEANAAGSEIRLDYWENYIGSLHVGRDEAAEVSAETRAHEIEAPVLLVHGDEDLTVPVTQSERMAEALETVGGEVELIVLEGEDHYLGKASSRLTILEESRALLERALPVLE
ncbi:alpha/beta hydrolase family protein [Marinicauda salina]|nr:prolyl oligopeptidase family serine peptidase [Marinicauda salina]